MKLLVVGAAGGIGSALVSEARTEGHQVYAISSQREIAGVETLHASLLQEPQSIGDWVSVRNIDTVISCSGLLHNSQMEPEKRLGEFDAEYLAQNLALNCTAHLYLLQQLEQAMSPQIKLKVLALSAMVGSINDNRIGGWYSYRMSKAALNMGIKNVAIEWSRTRPNWAVAAAHPGTTDTALSAPFTKRLPEDRLFSPERSARRLLKVANDLKAADSGRLLHWDGSALAY
jgi:NAD(P)-dependent dehydrogenase (short-subunit alcohol dehydrogenase family)